MVAARNPGVPTSAKGILTSFLNGFGLGALADWAWNVYTHAGGGDIGMQLVQSELPDTKEYKTRFPAIAERTKKGLPAISPVDYINYETSIRQAFTAHGLALPVTGSGFNDIIHELLVNDVSASEVINDRIGSAFDRVANAPVEVRQAAEKVWGIKGDQALASLFLDPHRTAPELEKLSQSMDIAGNAQRLGINLTAQRAGRLADLGADAQLSKLNDLATMRQLFDANVGEDPNLTLEDQGVGAVFGESAAAQQEVNRRLQARKAAFAGGGGPAATQKYATTDQGLSGLGSGSGG